MPTYIDFLDLILKPEEFALYFKELKNKSTDTQLYSNLETPIIPVKQKVQVVFDIPDYLSVKWHSNYKKTKIKKLNSYKGSMITLSNYKNLADYLKNNFSPKKRAQFRTYKKRLETSFNISYKVYYGAITKEEYNRLFAIFPKLIKKRFDLIGKNHHDLAVWDRYEENGFALINAKKACLFVVYDEDKPISIALNPVLNKVMYGYVRTFDADYAKFYLGFTDLFLQLEWCYKNNIELYDLLKGTYDYKSKLTDHAYFFNKYLIYDASSFVARFTACFYSLKIQGFYSFVKWLKKLHVHTAYHKYLQHKEEKLQEQQKAKLSWRIEQNIAFDALKIARKVNWRAEHLDFLRRPIYDFLYTSKYSNHDLEVFELTDAKNAYAIKGKSSIQKIIFTKTA
tara:strand:+ start:52502 stop:53689 length:1188 start_codon:yes stop_codon:yes gene_type:complete